MTVLPRAAAGLFSEALATLRVVIVTGPRQAGKSTFVANEPALQSRPYLTLHDPATRRRARDNPAAFVRSSERMSVDEVQREPELILAIKSVVDRQRPAIPGQLVLTVSANLLLMKHVGNSLAGRAHYLRLWPMCRREQLGLGACGYWQTFFEQAPERWLRHFSQLESDQADWRRQAERGGFPEAVIGIARRQSPESDRVGP